MADDEEGEWWDYESGPFCQHWSTVGSGCDEACAGCGHACERHSYDMETPCDSAGCACSAFAAKPER